RQPGAELALAASMNSNIHIETNANARDAERRAGPGTGTGARAKRARRSVSGAFCPRVRLTDAGEVDYESADEADPPAADPFRMQLTGTAYFLFLAAKTLIMYIHHAKMSAFVLARRSPGPKPVAGPGAGGGSSRSSDSGDGILPSSSVSVNDGADGAHAQAVLEPDFVEDLSPPPQLRTLADIRRMQDRLEVTMAALRAAQKYWVGVDYYVLCARKLRNMMDYGPWRGEDPVSSELANEAWPAEPPRPGADPHDDPVFAQPQPSHA
ncbi:hypothetical protein H4R19_005561, partial [Coemansia spiralis]